MLVQASCLQISIVASFVPNFQLHTLLLQILETDIVNLGFNARTCTLVLIHFDCDIKIYPNLNKN